MTEQTPEIDPFDNRESRVAEQVAHQENSSASDSGVVMSDAPSAEEGAHGVIGDRITGTDEGGLLSGITKQEGDDA